MSGSTETPTKTPPPATTPAPAATPPAAAAAPAIKPETLVTVVDPTTKQTMQVPFSKVMERFTSATQLEQQVKDNQARFQANARMLGFAQEVREKLKTNPREGLAQLTKLAEELSGQKLTSEEPTIDESALDPTMKVLLRRIDGLTGEIANLRNARASDQAITDVDRTLDKIQTFKTSPAARQLGQLVTLALKEKDPSMHVDDVAVFVNDLFERAHQERLQLAHDARVEAENAGSALPGGSADPVLSQTEPLKVADLHNGRMRDGIQKVVNAWVNKLKP